MPASTTPISIVKQAHASISAVLIPGDTALDATAGNGHDTLFLAQHVGPTGKVFAFDIQADALTTTRQRLIQHACIDSVALIQDSHTNLKKATPSESHGQIKAIMFNLGYLPGGDKSITTEANSSITALQIACSLIHPKGVITVALYPGHPAGLKEAKTIKQWSQTSIPSTHTCQHYKDPTRLNAPELLTICPSKH